MSEEKLYRVKTKENAHINLKLNDDGSRAAIQFDDQNHLKGPVDLIEVDESELSMGNSANADKRGSGIGEIIMGDIVVPAVQSALTELLISAAQSGARSFEKWAKQKVIPSVKAKGGELIDKAREAHAVRKVQKSEQKQNTVMTTHSFDVAPETAQSENDPVTRTSEEVDKLLQNMRKAALYIAAGIKELSKTVIDDDGTDPEKVREIQEQIEKLSDKKVMDSIDFMLEDRNRQMLDQATIHMFEAFRNREVVAEGKVISIEKYVKKRELIKRFVAILYNYKTSLEQGTEIKLENEKIREVL